MNDKIKSLVSYLDSAHSVYHAAAGLVKELENAGYTVGIISQPNWKDPKSIAVLGKPRLGFLVSGGEVNTERMAHVLLDEFRGGKLGRITLERP